MAISLSDALSLSNYLFPDKRIANHQTVDQAGTVTIKADSSKTPREEYGRKHIQNTVKFCVITDVT